jgi:hypothetical protein
MKPLPSPAFHCTVSVLYHSERRLSIADQRRVESAFSKRALSISAFFVSVFHQNDEYHKKKYHMRMFVYPKMSSKMVEISK